MEIRNIAIIAHVDHGKTTLTDSLMRQCGMVEEGFSMDSNTLEMERGITIYAKNASLNYKGTKINIVDTPGHSDFGSEVERVLRSIDNVLLIVDAQEGPMPQTRFVLKKSLELGLKPIVVINKIDKPAADPVKTHDAVLELFMDLGANDSQLDFTTVYAIGRQGVAKRKLTDESKDLTPLLDTILEKVAPVVNPVDVPFRMQPFNLAYDNFLGREAICRVYEGTVRDGDNVFVKKLNGETHKGKITKIYNFEGMKRVEVKEAISGDIVMIAGIPEIYIGETICKDENAVALPSINIDEPTISMNFFVNDSPFGGRVGKLVTSRQIRERLEKELEVNVGLKVDFTPGDYYIVYGRGELHISILLEYMRREGFEIQVSQPQVIIKDIEGVKSEPFEEVVIDAPEEYSGAIMEKITARKGNIMEMKQHGTQSRMIFEIPTRGILGYRGQFIVDTRGEGIMSTRFIGFKEYAGEIRKQKWGAMISMTTGKVAGFALDNLQQRGTLYIQPGDEVYEGMVVGNVTKGEDMYVNPTKGKQLTNMRSSSSDHNIYLAAPLKLGIENSMEMMNEDEYIEITPDSIRLRKKFLTEASRQKANKK